MARETPAQRRDGQLSSWNRKAAAAIARAAAGFVLIMVAPLRTAIRLTLDPDSGVRAPNYYRIVTALSTLIEI